MRSSSRRHAPARRRETRNALFRGLDLRRKDHFRKFRTRREDLLDDLASIDEALTGRTTDDEPLITLADAEDCLAEFAEEEAAVYRLRFGRGATRKQTADRLGLADHKIGQHVTVLEAGRLCAKRSTG